MNKKRIENEHQPEIKTMKSITTRLSSLFTKKYSAKYSAEVIVFNPLGWHAGRQKKK